MSVDRIAALERRITELEAARKSSLGMAVLGLAAAVVMTHAIGIGAQSGSETLTARAPFRVVNSRGEEILTVTQAGSETRLSLFDHGVAAAVLSAGDGPAVLTLGGSKGTARLAMDFDGPATGPSILLKDSDGEVLRAGSKTVSIQAPLIVSPEDEPMLSVDKENVKISGTITARASKGPGTSIGPAGVRVLGADGVSVLASLGADAAGKGRLVVGLPTGARGVLGQPASGGISFGLFDQPGGQYRIGMSATPDSSTFLRLYTGKRSADLTVSAANSALHLYNDEGFAASSLSASSNGFGRLELGDSAGNTTVEAGTTDEGRGVVRVGPRMGGVVGFEGSLPWAILGKK